MTAAVTVALAWTALTGIATADPAIPPPARFAVVTTHRDATRFTDPIARQVAQISARAVVNNTAQPYVSLIHKLHPGFQIAFYQSGVTSRHEDPAPECDAHPAGYPTHKLIRPAADNALIHVPNCGSWEAHEVATCRANLAAGADVCSLDSMGYGTYVSAVDATTGRPATPDMAFADWLAAVHQLQSSVVRNTVRRLWENCGSDGGWLAGYDQQAGCDDRNNVAMVQVEGYASPGTVDRDSALMQSMPLPVLWDCKMTAGYDRAWLDRCLSVFDAAAPAVGAFFNADVEGAPALQLDASLSGEVIP